MVNQPQSWGRTPRLDHRQPLSLHWRGDQLDFSSIEGNVLPYGYGRSYGDSCLNENGTLLLCSGLHRFIELDEDQQLLRCEAGVRFDELLDLIVPRGFFVPVTPGTKMLSVGGAIANDVHGKNHHVAGTFGCHVTQFELLRSNGERLLCSEHENSQMFRATIGGLGLTGLILWAEFRLVSISSVMIQQRSTRFRNIDEYLETSRNSDSLYNYVVSWIDCSSSGAKLGRGIFQGGNFVTTGALIEKQPRKQREFTVPFNFPSLFMNRFSVRAFNFFYFHKQWRRSTESLIHYNPFFYPLDALHQWNRIYGSNGFYQYQFVVAFDEARAALREVLQRSARHAKTSFVTVLKNFGPRVSPGMLSFPREGVTLALDFRNEGSSTLALLNELDVVVEAHGGRLYPAKDARMSARHFQTAYPEWTTFTQYIDPKFSSSFWRRVSKS